MLQKPRNQNEHLYPLDDMDSPDPLLVLQTFSCLALSLQAAQAMRRWGYMFLVTNWQMVPSSKDTGKHPCHGRSTPWAAGNGQRLPVLACGLLSSQRKQGCQGVGVRMPFAAHSRGRS